MNSGNIPSGNTQLTLSYNQSKIYLIEGLKRLVRIEPDTSIIAGFYLQVEGQDQYCLKNEDGFVNLGVEEEGQFNADLCAYDENQSVLGCLTVNIEVQPPGDDIFCDKSISEVTWDWRYSIFNNNLFNYPYYNPSRPRTITGYCRTSDGTIENELTLEEEGWTNFVHMIMKDEDKSFKWISNWYSKHWDILTTDCNKVGYDIDTVEQVFKGSYDFDPAAPSLDLKFNKQHPEEGKHNIYLSCNVMVITRITSGADGSDDAGFTMVFTRLENDEE